MGDWIQFLPLGLAIVAVVKVWLVSRQVHNVHVELNSRLTELLVITAKASRAEGIKDAEDAAKAKDEIL
jgi:hypothetical protein